jgi:hypothetical protein
MTQRNPIVVFLLAAITGIYGLYWVIVTRDEMNSKYNTEIPPWWHLLIPILNIIFMYKYWSAAQKVSGVHWIVGFLLGPIGMFLVQSRFNALALPAGEQARAAA